MSTIAAEVEVCDDGTAADGKGCKADCSGDEFGWLCTLPGSYGKSNCAATCTYDAATTNWPINTPFECNDGNVAPADGCLGCMLEVGWVCDTSGNPTAITTCA